MYRFSFNRMSALIALAALGLPAVASAAISFRGVGGEIGMTSLGGTSAMTIGAHADLGELTPNLVLYPSVSYWSKSYNVYATDLSISLLRINGDARYYFPLEGNIKVFAGGGIAHATGKLAVGAESVSASEFQLNILGGVETRLGPSLIGFGEIRREDVNTRFSVGVTFPMGQ